MKRAALLCLVLSFVLTAQAGADTYTVNTTDDTSVPGGCDTDPQCSLRDALDLAANGTGHTVSVPSGTYVLTEGQLIMGSDTRLVGAGARTTIIDANDESRVIWAQGQNHIEGVTVTGGQAILEGDADGNYGGGILSAADFFLSEPASLTLVNSTVTGNTALYGGGGVATASVHGSEPGPLTITGSTISNNRVEDGIGSGRGGGVVAFDTLTMTNSTVSGNSVDNPGFASEGGGISATSGGTTLRNVTIAGNTTAGSSDLGAGIAGDDAGIPPFDSELTATNTIVAGNTHDGDPSDCGLVEVVETDNNISSDDSCDFDDAGSKENTNPQLLGLANNTGQTDTRKFAPGAPPHNAGTPVGCPGTDQRGIARPQGAACDIGAVELAPPTAITGGTSGLTRSSANLLGRSVNPFVQGGTASFEFGTTTAYGRTIPAGGVAANASEAESAAVSGLSPGTLYHYRLVVSNADGTSRGADATFTTPAALRRPTVAVAGVSRSCVRRAFTLRVRARVSRGTRLRAVRVTLDGRTIRRTSRARFSVRVNAARLRSGRHTLRIKAVDRGNRARTVTRTFRRCARVPVARPRFTG